MKFATFTQLIKLSLFHLFNFLDQFSLVEDIKQQLKIHSNIIEISDDSYVSLKQDTIKHPETSSNVTRLRNTTIEQAIPAMFAYHYGNQALQLLIHVSMVCLSLGTNGIALQDEGRSTF